MIDLNNIAAEAATTIVAAGAVVWRLYRKWAPRIKNAFDTIRWMEQHLQNNAAAQQATAEVEAAATTDDTAHRDALIKVALHDFLRAGRFEIANLKDAEIRAAVIFVQSKVPEPLHAFITQDTVSNVLQHIVAAEAQDANHEAIKAALVLQQPIQQPKEAM